jgi:hypothetical protein
MDVCDPVLLTISSSASVFGHRFVLTDADHYVLKYLESEADQIPSQTLESLRNRLGVHPDQGTGTNPTEEQYGGIYT